MLELVAKEEAAVERHAVAEAEVEVAAEKEAGPPAGPREGAGGQCTLCRSRMTRSPPTSAR